jgi:hypothetical protein
MANPIKLLILVAGHEYSTKKLDFDVMCTHRAQEIVDELRDALIAKKTGLAVTPPVTLRFLRFHFTTGTIEVFDHDVDDRGGKTETVKWAPISSITTGDTFDPNSFCTKRTLRAVKSSDYPSTGEEYPAFISTGTDADQVMSIVDVYEAVQGAPDGSILELSIFSHGWRGGPILVNSDEASGTPADKRDRTDKDGRAAKDFLTNMGDGSTDDNLSLFSASFDKNGFFQVWGCQFEKPALHVLNLAYYRHLRKGDALGKTFRKNGAVDDTTSFDLDYSDWVDDYDEYDPHDPFFPTSSTTTEFSATFLDIKKFIARRCSQAYIFVAAQNTKVLCLGAVPGTEGDDEKTKHYNLMQVCRKMTRTSECPVGFAPYLEFYRVYVGINNDPKRGYGIIDQTAVTKVVGLL